MKKIVKSRLVAVHRNKVMVLKKKGVSKRYTLPGGIQKKKENEVETLIRETAEEIQLDLTKGQVNFYVSLTKTMSNEAIIKNYFYCVLEPRKIKVNEKHKFDSVIWMDWKIARDHMDKSDRLALSAYFKNKRLKSKKIKRNESTVSSRIAM